MARHKSAALILIVSALLHLFPTTVQCAERPKISANTTHAAVTFLKAVPPRASLAQIKKLLPKNTWYQDAESTTGGDWTWNAVKFGGRLSGVLVFANTRRAHVKSLKDQQSQAQHTTIGWLRPNDPIHYIEVFLGGVNVDDRSRLRTTTQRHIALLSRYLGRPTRKEWTGDEQGVGEQGWTAEWQRRGGRELWFLMSIAFKDSDERPLLGLEFPYSHLYRE